MNVADAIADVIALERQAEALLVRCAEDMAGQPRLEDEVSRLRRLAEEGRQALGSRLADVGGTERDFPVHLMPLSTAFVAAVIPDHRASRALHALYVAINHLGFAYALLHAVAHRHFDSTGEGNTADLAEERLRRYATAAQEINQVLSDVVVSELQAGGSECRCGCPSCSLGICICAPHGTNTINAAWRETTPEPAAPGIQVRPPRESSPAATAGLDDNDRIIGVDGQALASDLDTMTLQKAVSAHASGEPVRVEVLRGGSDKVEISLTRP